MSRILHLVNMGLRYGRSKGVRETRLEEPPLGNLAAPCHLEESASHHFKSRSADLRSSVLELFKKEVYLLKSADLRSSVLELPREEVYLLKWFLP